MEGGVEEAFKSPQEDEDGIISTKIVTRNPFIVLPKEIYVRIFDLLEKGIDKHNFMNAHIKWYELFKSNRALFLFQGVLEVISKIGDKERFGLTRQDPYNYRLVCHDWAEAVENFFQLDPIHFTLETNCKVALRTIEDKWGAKRFIWKDGYKLKDDLDKYSAIQPSKNPFLSRSIILLPYTLYNSKESTERYRESVYALLERFGKHIWHCKMRIERKPEAKAFTHIAKWLSLMPELITLEIRYFDAWYMTPIIFDMNDRRELVRMTMPQPELNKLIVLKSSYLPSLVFNKLFGNIKRLERVQLKFLKGEDSLKDFGLETKRNNLREVFFTLNGLEDIQYLGRSMPFLKVRKLIIKLGYNDGQEEKQKAYMEWPEWKMLWLILETNFPNLEELRLELPKAAVGDELEATNQSLECRLSLRKLKKLLITLPNLASIDFLLPCKALEELSVTIEHHMGGLGWSGVEKEQLKFNVDLNTMWESNVWEEFPKMRGLHITSYCEDGSFDFYRYEKVGEKKKKKYFKQGYKTCYCHCPCVDPQEGSFLFSPVN